MTKIIWSKKVFHAKWWICHILRSRFQQSNSDRCRNTWVLLEKRKALVGSSAHGIDDTHKRAESLENLTISTILLLFHAAALHFHVYRLLILIMHEQVRRFPQPTLNQIQQNKTHRAAIPCGQCTSHHIFQFHIQNGVTFQQPHPTNDIDV